MEKPCQKIYVMLYNSDIHYFNDFKKQRTSYLYSMGCRDYGTKHEYNNTQHQTFNIIRQLLIQFASYLYTELIINYYLTSRISITIAARLTGLCESNIFIEINILDVIN